MKKNYVKITILGFVVLYLVCMVFATYLSKNNFEKEFEAEKEQIVSEIAEQLSYDELSYSIYSYYNDGRRVGNLQQYMNYLLSEYVNFGVENAKYHQLSAAIYDGESGKKVAQSGNIVWDNVYQDYQNDYYVYHLEDYLSDEDVRQIQECYVALCHRKAGDNSDSEKLSTYEIILKVDEETAELKHLVFNEKITVDWHLQGEVFVPDEVMVTPLIEWTAEDYKDSDKSMELQLGINDNLGVIFPYLTEGFAVSGQNGITFKYSYGLWKKWNENEFLQSFPKEISEIKNDTYCTEISVGYQGFGEGYQLCIRETKTPWLAALDYMKFAYLVGALFVLLCIAIIVHSSNKYYKQRELLEASRRDFTNAIAHELKTPLGIIRGFAENSLENTVGEKREYYLQQIIGQTEEMDKLVKEMIYISKLDSEEIRLKKERVSITEVVREQMAKLKPLIDEKNLEVSLEAKEDFLVEGDKQYLERAIWNLLSNAVEYNQLDGWIQVHIEKSECRITNTGKQISAEDLPHVFEMFYTSDKSRGSAKKHMGLGLYLAEKILRLHKLQISIKNTETGVEVKIDN